MNKPIDDISVIDFSIFNKSFVEKTISVRISETKCNSLDEYNKYLKNNINESDKLKRALNNNYSEFFRNTFTFSFLEHRIIPLLYESMLTKSHREIRIWSAACAGGHEAYSIAIICDEFSKIYNSGLKFRIFATDINELEIEKAKKGVYTENVLKNVTFDRIKNYFTQKGDNFIVNQKLKETIDFSNFDLLSKECNCPPASIFGNFDIVFCSNLLFYYNSNAQKSIINKVDKCLADNGYLIVGEAERDIVIKYDYKEIFSQLAIFKKNGT